jgi:hypothetical protein
MKVMSNELTQLRAIVNISSSSIFESLVSTSNSTFISSLNSQMTALMQLLLVKNFESRSKKLLDISKYDENEAQLNF